MSHAHTKLTFPHEKLTKIGQEQAPTAVEVKTLKSEVYANAMSITSVLGENDTGLLGMFMPAPEFQALPNITGPFVIPNHPGPPVLHGTADARANQLADHKETERVFYEAQSAERQIKNLILEAVPALYLEELKDMTLGYANISAEELLEHLEDNYGTIDADDLEANADALETPWDPTTPIENVFTNAKRCRDIAEAGGDPMSDAHIMRGLSRVFEKSGIFPTAIHEWKIKPAAENTLNNFKTHFINANKERNRNPTTVKAVLEQAFAAKDKASTMVPVTEEMFYCWTHGMGYNKEHTSATCTAPQAGHVRNATCYNKQGGNCTIRRKNGEKAVYKRPARPAGNNNATTTTGTNE
jgi:hypothetical protein